MGLINGNISIAYNYLAGYEDKAGIGSYSTNLVENIRKIKPAWEYHLFHPENEIRRTIRKAFWDQIEFPYKIYKSNRDFNLIHTLGYSAPIIRPKGKRLPSVFSLHDLYPAPLLRKTMSRGTYLYLKHLKSLSAYSADVILTLSENSKKDILDQIKIPEQRVRVVYIAASDRFSKITDNNILEAVKIKYNIRLPFILFLGTISPHKNLIRLVEAFSILKNESSEFSAYSLVLCGSRGNATDKILEKCRELRIIESVILTGYTDEEDVPAIYSMADLFVFPSLSEGFGIPPLEAMKCETPVACSDNTSMPEVCGDAAIYFNCYDTKSIAEAMYRILNDGILRDSLRQKGLLQASKFSWEKAARETIAIYNELL